MDQPFAEILGAAAARTAETEFQPTAETFLRLRAALDAYEAVARCQGEAQVMERVFGALNAEVPANLVKVTKEQVNITVIELRNALNAVLEHLGPVTAKTNGVHVSAPVPPPPAPLTAPVLTASTLIKRAAKTPLTKDVEGARRVLKEIGDLRRTGVGDMSPLRLLPLLQAIAAEARYLVEQLPENDPLHRMLVNEFRQIVKFKEDANISDFINGLSHGARGDWTEIARENRAAVARFDKALAKVEKEAAPELPKVETTVASVRFPKLLRLIQESGKLPIIGGLEIKERLDHIKNELGIEATWYECEKKSPRQLDTIVARLSSGKTPAVVLLEHFISSTAIRTIMKACETAHVQYVTAGRGGTGALELAFMALEGRLQ
jgi:hypothetical protein